MTRPHPMGVNLRRLDAKARGRRTAERAPTGARR